MQERKYTLNIAGREVVASFSDLAMQAGGSVMMSCDDTVVLATACISSSNKNNPGFFNLTVEYVERHYAAGKILGGQWNKREGRPSDQAVLASRVIDRTIRPLFPHYIKNAVQVIVTVVAVGKMDPKILAVNAASLALSVSPIPFAGPIGAVSITVPKGLPTGQAGETDLKMNNYLPTVTEPTNDLDLVVCGMKGKVCMIEAQAYEYSNDKVGEALDLAMTGINAFENWQNEIISKEAKPKLEFAKPAVPAELLKMFEEKVLPVLKGDLFGDRSKKVIHEAETILDAIVDENYKDDDVARNAVWDYMHEVLDGMFHDGATKDGRRADMRAFTEVRPLFAKAGGISPVLHGSGIFYRGETHVMSVLTLDGPGTRQEVDGIEANGKKRFIHHYNFPPYSTGETGRMGGMNRREMGHGFLAEKALVPVIPDYETFPYTIRLVSESTSSNGSTSQASICAASIAMMDGGVPIKSPVAGIAMGLMEDANDENNYKILTDIQGPEDHYGDMDFKVAGTKDGVTAIQLDIKLTGVSVKILKEALLDAENARKHILETITKEIAEPRKYLAPSAPRIEIIKIAVDQIGMVIGPGGKNVNGLRDATGTEITIEEDGKVLISGHGDGPARAKKIIGDMTHVYKVGDIIEDAEVMRIADFGAFVKISSSAEALVHISEIAPFRVEKVDEYLKIGMKFSVQVIKVDEGKIGVSIKALNPNMFPKPEVKTPAPAPVPKTEN
jgi:polyribonucleotide nucleotidyltransferase